MTVATTLVFSEYDADGSTTAFGLNAYCQTADQVEVLIDDVVQSDAAYTVSGLRSPTGVTATFSTAPTSGTVRVRRKLPLTQGVDTQNNEVTYQEVFDDALDRGVMVDQQLAEEVGRALKTEQGGTDYPAGGGRITGLGAGAAASDAVNRSQLDAVRALIALAGAVSVSDFASLALVETSEVELSAAQTYFRTAGFAAPGDNGHGLYERLDAEPAHDAKIFKSDAWWGLVPEGGVRPEQLGAKNDGVTNDKAALEAADAAAGALGAPLVFGGKPEQGGYAIASTVTFTEAPVWDFGRHRGWIKYTGSADETAVRFGEAGVPTFFRRIEWADVRRATVSDGTQTAHIGIEIICFTTFHASIHRAEGFHEGVAFVGESAGCAHGQVFLNYLVNNIKQLVCRSSGTSDGYCNEITFYGGRYSVESVNYTALDRIGWWVTTTNGYVNNALRLVSPSFEMNAPATTGTAIGVLWDAAQHCYVDFSRDEGNDVSVRQRFESACNEIRISYGNAGGTSPVIQAIGRWTGPIVTNGRRPEEQRGAASWSSRSFRDAVHEYDGAGAMSWTGLAMSSAGGGVYTFESAAANSTLTSEYLQLSGGRGITCILETRSCKRFRLIRDCQDGYGGRNELGPFFDVNGAQLLGPTAARADSTAYVVGDLRYVTGHLYGLSATGQLHLECTAISGGGVSAASPPTFPQVNIGDTITDGNVTWTVRQNLARSVFSGLGNGYTSSNGSYSDGSDSNVAFPVEVRADVVRAYWRVRGGTNPVRLVGGLSVVSLDGGPVIVSDPMLANGERFATAPPTVPTTLPIGCTIRNAAAAAGASPGWTKTTTGFKAQANVAA